MSERTASGSSTDQTLRRATSGILQVVDLEAAEHDWEISPGTVVHGYAFNGQAPGPVIEATVGDTLLVRFTNLLPEPTTIRWRGLREPVAMDGSELAADPVPSGGRLQYQLQLPDAGTFWYGSSTNATTQSKGGLCGVLLVRNPDELPFDADRVLLIDDLKLNRGGQLGAPEELWQDRRGPEGEVLLVNGVLEPEMQITIGQVERWRLVNTTSARLLRLSLGDHQVHLIRTDGLTSHAVHEVRIAPGDRFDLAVGPFSTGETVVFEARSYDRGVVEPSHHTLATLHVAPGGVAHLDFSSGGMDTLKRRALDREEG
jgi:FtsP/CotA-like multicopper oxidase with cupredoxin domain